MLGNDEGLAEFNRWYEPRRGELDIVYASGRFVASVCESIQGTALPEPAAVIGGVGTEIRNCQGQPLDGWPAALARHWDGDKLCALLAEEPDLEVQPAYQISDWKKSYYLYDATPQRLDQLRQKLAAAGIAAEIIYSSNRDLDFLPAAVNKGSAARWLAEHWQCDEERVFVSGDSGNDLSMFQQGFRGIVVGNAHAELQALDGQLVYHARGQCAAGVLEGLQHWWQVLSS